MWIVSLLLSLVIAILLTLVFAGVSRRRAWRLFAVFFLLIFLAAWAGQLWLRPAGPAIYGVFWVPSLVVGVLLALLLVMLFPVPAPTEGSRSSETVAFVEESREQDEAKRASALAVYRGAFWILSVLLLCAILAGYLV